MVDVAHKRDVSSLLLVVKNVTRSFDRGEARQRSKAIRPHCDEMMTRAGIFALHYPESSSDGEPHATGIKAG